MGKYRRYKQFYQNPSIRPYLPKTAICTPKTLDYYLKRYHMIYIKPDNGARGNGIIRARKSGNQFAYIIERGDPTYCLTTREMFDRLQLFKKRLHIVQQGIHLAKIGDRPFDIRLKMIRDASLKWNYIGMVAKVAGYKSIITNVNKGKGYVMKVEEALQKSLGIQGEEIDRKLKEIIRLGDHCNQIYEGKNYDWRIGYDIGIDRNAKVWLIEANRRPNHLLFAKLKDKSIYRRIQKMIAIYKGRNRKSV